MGERTVYIELERRNARVVGRRAQRYMRRGLEKFVGGQDPNDASVTCGVVKGRMDEGNPFVRWSCYKSAKLMMSTNNTPESSS